MRRGITRRWTSNVLAGIVLLLVLVEIAAIAAVRYYYYQNVENALELRARQAYNTFSLYVSSPTFDFETGAWDFVEAFRDKEKMELQVINADGKAVVSSSGFVPQEKTMPDYELAKTAEEQIGVWHGRAADGESIMAMTVMIRDGQNNVLGSVRYVVSLELVNRQLTIFSVLMLLFGLAIVFFVMLSSTYFVNTIVSPVAEIGRAARRIALGDYDFRIEKKYDDEIGDLCDTINYMAGEISAAEQMKNDFISSVSHELRTPLTAIKGWSETLREGGAGDAEMTAKGLEVISDEAERLSGIVEELLDFSRMQSGHISMQFTRMDLLAELEEAVVLFRDRAKREGIELLYVEAAELPPIVGDRDRLKQVFINIIDNAIKYSNPGGRVRVEAADMGAHVQVVISDSGVGIAKADLPNVKNKFYKAHRTRPGSGIGLALADEIVRRHKGRLEIESEEGVGTTVTITLPVAAKDE
ncbi:MAG: sensor histidine kinase [Acutalibacteraceae bacterium]